MSQGKKKALIIGISDYDELQPLDLCRNDAEELFRVLTEQGYEILDKYKLIGRVPYEPMRKTIIQFFNNKDNRREDTLLFYYSGHGLPDGYGKHFLAPSDVNPNSPFESGIDFEHLQYLAELTQNSVLDSQILGGR